MTIHLRKSDTPKEQVIEQLPQQVPNPEEQDETPSEPVKKAHPHLMRSALHYFPNWNSAVEKSISGL